MSSDFALLILYLCNDRRNKMAKNNREVKTMTFLEQEAEDLLVIAFALGLARRDPKTGLTYLVNPSDKETPSLKNEKPKL